MAILIAHKLQSFRKSASSAIEKYDYAIARDGVYHCDCWSSFLLSLRHKPEIDLCVIDSSIIRPNRLSSVRLIREQFQNVSIILLIDKIARFNVLPFFAEDVSACLKNTTKIQILVQTIKEVKNGAKNIYIH